MLRHFPDLAGTQAEEGLLTVESTQEQIYAGLKYLTTYEKQVIRQLNHEYKTKFHIPFVACARENEKTAIIEGLKNRIHNAHEIEIDNSLNEAKKICWLRLLDIVNIKSKQYER